MLFRSIAAGSVTAASGDAALAAYFMAATYSYAASFTTPTGMTNRGLVTAADGTDLSGGYGDPIVYELYQQAFSKDNLSSGSTGSRTSTASADNAVGPYIGLDILVPASASVTTVFASVTLSGTSVLSATGTATKLPTPSLSASTSLSATPSKTSVVS